MIVMPVDQSGFQRTLFSLLNQELASMYELKQVLDQETAALTYERDGKHLLQLVSTKDEKVRTLKQLELERNQLFHSIGLDGHPRKITDFLESEAMFQPILQLWQQLLDLTTQCQESNRLNGTIIKLDHQHLQQALGLLRANSLEDHNNYDPKGQATTSNSSRLLGQA
ncbi:MAG TPA: flagellar protein FlgN [Chromatiaceae bacterium]|nr:flagellar protein FlgN [Chromatiaceae bacterium]